MVRRIKGRINTVISRMKSRHMDSHISLNSRLYGNIFMEGMNWIAEGVEISDVSLGYGSYIASYSKMEKTKVGKYTSIGSRVITETGGEHPTSQYVSTHPCFHLKSPNIGRSYVDRDKFSVYKYVDNWYMVEIGNDVWIASDVKLMSGIKVGDGAIVAAGAIVTKDIPPYAVVGGVPAKIIKYRFGQDDIDYLLKLKWWNKDESWIKKYADYFDDLETLKEILEQENV